MAKFYYDPNFINFTDSLQAMLAGKNELELSNEEFTSKQKTQVESLIKAEKIFKKTLQSDSRGIKAYKLFIKYIVEDKKNILEARPFFRERQGEFSKGISPAIKSGNPKKLYKFNINFPFINFILEGIDWGKNSKITKAATEVKKIRESIIIQNLPLAISRARIFRQKTPESHLTFMDINQISFEGLINAVDKFVLPYSPVFRSVIIGRIVGDLIGNYSDTMMHFYPSDKRKIYRANKANKNKSEVNYERLAESVNQGPALPSLTDAAEIQNLLTAASHVSLYTPVSDELNAEDLCESIPDVDENRPDFKYEENEMHQALFNAVRSLSVYKQKLIKLLGYPI